MISPCWWSGLPDKGIAGDPDAGDDRVRHTRQVLIVTTNDIPGFEVTRAFGPPPGCPGGYQGGPGTQGQAPGQQYGQPQPGTPYPG